MVRLAEILGAVLPRYSGAAGVAPVVGKALRAIVNCRTAVLGGHVKRCKEHGHVVGVWYNACRNRMCPRCSFSRVQKWLQRQVNILVGSPHHHIIFTVPHELNVLWQLNYVVLGELLFATSQEALFELASNPKYLGAQPGAVMALHTWGQQLAMHPHVHCLASAGGVTESGEWVWARRHSFLPAEPLKRLFRAKYLYGLRGLLRRGELRLRDDQTARGVEALLAEAEHKRWNVHICDRYESPTAVLNYLGRYLHGGPIGEKRLESFDGETVAFWYKDYRDRTADGPKKKLMHLSVDEFVRRFAQHVPPKGFHMVRAYGPYRRGGKAKALRERILEVAPVSLEVHESLSRPRFPRPEEPTACPSCGSALEVVPLTRGHPLPRVA